MSQRTFVLLVSWVSLVLAACTPGGAAPAPTALPPTAALSTKKPVALPQPYNEQADAQQDIRAALALAKADHKNILLDFGANWCPDCLVLSRIFEDAAVKPFLDANYHVVKIDVGQWTRNLDISVQYDRPIDKGIPAVVILSPTGEIITSTKNGELADARTAKKQDVLDFLRQWAAQKK